MGGVRTSRADWDRGGDTSRSRVQKAPEFFPSLERKLRIVGAFSLPSLSPGGGRGGRSRMRFFFQGRIYIYIFFFLSFISKIMIL